MKIFIVGPGGVGKSTSGKILADKLEFSYIDLDQEFCNNIKNVGEYIQNNGYKKYCYRNSKLFYTLLESAKENFVFVLSSGFLVHEHLDDLVSKHRQTLAERGTTILLLPSESLEESTDIVVRRQMQRGFDLQEERERVKFAQRYPRYRNCGDIQIFSYKSPEEIACEMQEKLHNMIV